MKTLVAVEGQTLRWYGKIPEIADNSVQFVQLEFSLPEDWVDLVVVAQFSQTKTYNKPLENGCCYLPAELAAGPCEVSLFGQRAGDTVRATSVPLRFKISRSGFTSTAETPIPPTPDLYAQLLEKLGHQGPSESVSVEDDGEGNVSFVPGFEGDGEDHELNSLNTGKTVYTSFPDKVAREGLKGKLANPGGLTPGKLLRVKSVDQDGSILLEGADMPSEGSSVVIDTTLTQPGQAADAKATGDAISKLSGQNVALDTTLTQRGQAADAKTTGDEIRRVEGLIPSIEGLAKTKDVPTKPEDIGAQPAGHYLTEAPVQSVNGKTGAVVLAAVDVGALPAGTKIPAKTSDLSNDSGFINKTVGDLVNYYTKKQTDDLIAQIPKFRISVVQQLPATGEELVLYLVPFSTAEGQYLEYIWTGGRFEVIGSQKVDLTGYATEKWVQQGYQPKGSYLLSTALPGAIEEALAQAKASGKFDGRDGEDGITPHIGANGNWWIGNTDTGIKAQGPAGAAGRGIKSNARTSGNGAAGTTDTYTITYTDGTTSTYQVRNGANGQAATLAITGVTALAAGAAPTVTEDSGSTAQNRKYIIGIPAGKTPVKGTDYFTDADKSAMVQQVISTLPKYAGEVEAV